MSHKEKFPLVPKIINGGIAGLIGILCVFPLDLVKTRLQNQQIGPNGVRMYKNMFDCLKKSYRAEGLIGLYRGSFINVILITPEKAIKLSSNDYFRYKLTTADGELPMWRQLISGCLTGVCQIGISTPMELLKIQMQDAGRVALQAKLTGKIVIPLTTSDVIRKTLESGGILNFYRGVTATLLRDVFFSIVYFPLFAYLQDLGPRRADGEAVFWCSFLAGLCSGSITGLVITPLDVIKTRLQTFDKAVGEKAFTGFMDCFYKTLTYEGPRAFFKGGLCRMFVIAPLYGIAQVVYLMGIGEKIVSSTFYERKPI